MKNKNDDKYEQALDSQIGGLGELREKNLVLGTKPGLTEEEQKSYDDFMARSKNHSTTTSHDQPSSDWILLDRETMGTRSQFYPSDWTFYVRPATVAATRAWSSIDDENPEAIWSTSNDIIRTCVKIQSSSGNIAWNNVRSWDRFWFILKVREYTFSVGECVLEYEDQCDVCGCDITYTLDSQSLAFDCPDQSVVDDNYDCETATYTINFADYDLNPKVLKLTIPTIAKDKMIIDAARRAVAQRKTPDQDFIKYLPYLLPYAIPNDATRQDALIQRCRKEYKSWSADEAYFMQSVIDNIQVTPSDTLTKVCSECGGTAHSMVRFPSGLKHLFKHDYSTKRFGPK